MVSSFNPSENPHGRESLGIDGKWWISTCDTWWKSTHIPPIKKKAEDVRGIKWKNRPILIVIRRAGQQNIETTNQ